MGKNSWKKWWDQDAWWQKHRAGKGKGKGRSKGKGKGMGKGGMGGGWARDGGGGEASAYQIAQAGQQAYNWVTSGLSLGVMLGTGADGKEKVKERQTWLQSLGIAPPSKKPKKTKYWGWWGD